MEISVEVLKEGTFFDEWDALARSSPSGIFATAEWHVAVQRAYANRGNAIVAAIREEDRLVGVAPLRLSPRFLFRDATMLGMGEGGYGLADYAGLLAAPGREREVAQAVVAWLRDRGGWDVLDLQQLQQGKLTEALLDAIGRTGLRFLVRQQNICHVIELPATWAEYRARLSVGARNWLERKPRKAERELGATVEFVEPNRLLEEYATMRRLQVQRFGGQSEEAERKLSTVIAAWLPVAYERGWLRMFRLRSGSRTIGVLLGYEYEDAFYFHSAAFDSMAYGTRYSLGASLLAAALRWSMDHGLKRFDMLRGHYEYKERLGSRQRHNYRVMVFRQPVVGRALEAALRMRTVLKRQPPWHVAPALPGALLSPVDGSERSPGSPEHVAGAAIGVE